MYIAHKYTNRYKYIYHNVRGYMEIVDFVEQTSCSDCGVTFIKNEQIVEHFGSIHCYDCNKSCFRCNSKRIEILEHILRKEYNIAEINITLQEKIEDVKELFDEL